MKYCYFKFVYKENLDYKVVQDHLDMMIGNIEKTIPEPVVKGSLTVIDPDQVPENILTHQPLGVGEQQMWFRYAVRS